MRRILLWISIWAICFSLPEVPPPGNQPVARLPGPAVCLEQQPCTYTCDGVPHTCPMLESCGCRYSFTFNVTLDKWIEPIDKPKNFSTHPGSLQCSMEHEKRLGVTCFDKDCVMPVDAAVELCLKTVNRTCGGKTKTGHVLKTSNDKLGCLLTVENNDDAKAPFGPLKLTVGFDYMKEGENTTCKEATISNPALQTWNHKIRYFCGSEDECHKPFNVSTQISECAGGMTYMQCGNDERIWPREQFCWFTWERHEDDLVQQSPVFHDSMKHPSTHNKCPSYDGEEIVVLCEKNCKTSDITAARRDSEEFCAAKIKSNQTARQAVLIAVPILILVAIFGIAYVTVRMIRKARYAHSLVLLEYQSEFGSVKKSGSNSKLKKKKRKSSGKRSKRGLEGPPF